MRLVLYMSTDHFVLQCFDTVGWAMLPVKIVRKNIYYVLGWTLNFTRCSDWQAVCKWAGENWSY